MLSRSKGFDRSGDMEWIGRRDDDRIHIGVRKHLVIVEVDAFGIVELSEPLGQ